MGHTQLKEREIGMGQTARSPGVAPEKKLKGKDRVVPMSEALQGEKLARWT